MARPTFGPVTEDQEFKIVTLSEVNWFIKDVVKAVEVAHKREYKPDVVRPRMVINVGGHDCLATDEDLDKMEPEPLSHVDTNSSIDMENLPTQSVDNVRKTEVIAMAAKMFGFDPHTHIYSESCP